jgi:hypothetical protein
MTEKTIVRLPKELPTPAKEKERVLPRISKARGGPRPGIDLVKTSKLLAELNADELGLTRSCVHRQ